MLYVPERHEKLIEASWSTDIAQQTIEKIVAATVAEFQGEQLWSVHPDIKQFYQVRSPITGLWFGAAGTMWALTELQNNNPSLPAYDFKPYLQSLVERQPSSLAEFSSALKVNIHTPGYLLGYSGVKLLCWKLTKANNVLDDLAKHIESNINNPRHEFMWAAPGSMLCAWFLYQQTKEERWLDLFRKSADYMFSTWELDKQEQLYIWVQHMYGSDAAYLGAIHGFVGNIFPLLKGIELLSDEQRALLIERAETTLLQTAMLEDDGANWLPCFGSAPPGCDEPMLQLCHGAPGIVIATSAMWPLASFTYQELLIKAGNLIWQAGPLKKPWGLCHGTAGNGYAFLKLYTLTGDEHWLDKARLFAMHAITQYQNMRDQYGCIRTDAWCGDLGLALYLQDCIAARSDFPMLDYF